MYTGFVSSSTDDSDVRSSSHDDTWMQSGTSERSPRFKEESERNRVNRDYFCALRLESIIEFPAMQASDTHSFVSLHETADGADGVGAAKGCGLFGRMFA